MIGTGAWWLGFIGGFGFALFLGWVLGRPHKHKLVAKAVCPMTNTLKNEEGVVIKAISVTEVLWVCGCGHSEAEEFVGSWKLEDFEPPSPTTKKFVDDLAQLRKMAELPPLEEK